MSNFGRDNTYAEAVKELSTELSISMEELERKMQDEIDTACNNDENFFKVFPSIFHL